MHFKLVLISWTLHLIDQDFIYLCRFKQKSPWPWLAITTAIGILVIALLVSHIFHATLNRILRVEDDYLQMTKLKKRAEAADVAKSQVHSSSVFRVSCIWKFKSFFIILLIFILL